MSKNKKPRKAYRARPITADTMALAIHYAAKPADADIEEVLQLLNSDIQAMRQGISSEQQWSRVGGSISVALAIEHLGVVRGLKDYLDRAETAIQNIYDRAMKGGTRWMAPTLYATEITTLQEFFELHTFQVQQLGRREFLRAIDAAHKSITAQGHKATVVTDIQRMAA